ncbi:conserved protein [Tepidicaulis marinus]|uniref:Conserved protein n=1 Tax=Tepidicaulis marinus TaxID=1333998 RepID=A0A081BAU1_9HYPH|nr:hypothetical protein [Tepidicaulis marinus]GAK45159.1 conserved protein [Tepidicaulis marinus]
MLDEISDAEKASRLGSYLTSLPAGMALKLLSGVERAVVAGEEAGLPIEFIRQAVRPIARSLEGRRPGYATAQRRFCLPFEGLLVNLRTGRKIPGLVPRASINPVWEVLRADLLPDTFPSLVENVSRHILHGDPEALGASLSVMRQSAARALLEAEARAGSDPGYREVLDRRLGGAQVRADAVDIAHALAIGDDILALSEKLPETIEEFDESCLRLVRETYDRVYKEAPDHSLYIAFAVMGRMEQPWQIMRLARSIARQNSDLLIARTDLAALGERLLIQSEDICAQVCALRPGVTSLEPMAEEVLRLANISKGFREEIDLVRYGAWEKRVFAVRQKMSTAIGDHLARFERDLHGALPLQQAGAFGKAAISRADLSKRMSLEKAEKVRASFRFMLATWARADVLGVSQIYRDLRHILDTYLALYTEALITELRLAATKPEMEPPAAAFAAELLELLEGEEAAALFRRRVQVALRETVGAA